MTIPTPPGCNDVDLVEFVGDAEFDRHVLNCLVQNEPGVLSRVSGILAGRGFNIDSLVVCRTEIRDLSRMCIVLSGQDGVVEQARRQLEDLVRILITGHLPICFFSFTDLYSVCISCCGRSPYGPYWTTPKRVL